MYIPGRTRVNIVDNTKLSTGEGLSVTSIWRLDGLIILTFATANCYTLTISRFSFYLERDPATSVRYRICTQASLAGCFFLCVFREQTKENPLILGAFSNIEDFWKPRSEISDHPCHPPVQPQWWEVKSWPDRFIMDLYPVCQALHQMTFYFMLNFRFPPFCSGKTKKHSFLEIHN